MNIDLDKIYSSALNVDPKDFIVGNYAFEEFVKLANPVTVCAIIDRLRAAEEKLAYHQATTNASMHGCAFRGWQCFHCGEIFETVGGAQDHFGADQTKTPGCLLKVQYGVERGLEIELRKVEAQRDALQKRIDEAEKQEPDSWRVTKKEFCGTHTVDPEIGKFWMALREAYPLYAKPHIQAQEPEMPVLKMPARVGAANFHAGVKATLVIEAAQRNYEEWKKPTVIPDMDSAKKAFGVQQLTAPEAMIYNPNDYPRGDENTMAQGYVNGWNDCRQAIVAVAPPKAEVVK